MIGTRALLPPALADRARSWAVRLGERLLREARERPEPADRSLGGTAGYCLAFRALWQATGDVRFRDASHAQLRRAAGCTDVPQIGLFSGISGLRAVAALYVEEAACATLAERCDAYVEPLLPDPRDAVVARFADYDLMAGWGGVRLARCIDGPREADRSSALLEWLLEDDARWCHPHPLRPDEPAESDLGLAHGIAGVLAVLALTVAHPTPRLRALMSRQARALAGCAVAESGIVSFPRVRQLPGITRRAWCYGTAGVGAALFWTARLLADEALAAQALDALESIARPPAERWGLHDRGLCHGTFGNALVFASAGTASGSRVLLEGAARAVEHGLDGLERDGGACWANRPDLTRYDASGVLDGAAGIALALVTLTGDAGSAWMRAHALEPLARNG